MKIRLDNQDFTSSTEGLDEFKVTYSLDSTQTINVSTTSGLTFKGDSYDYLYDVFYSEREGFQNVVDVSITVDCGGFRTYTFLMKFDNVTWCPHSCQIRANLVKLDDKVKCYDYLNSKVFWKHGLLGQLNNTQYFGKMNYLITVTNAIQALWGLWKAARFLGLGIIDWFNETFGDGNGFVNRVEDWLSGAGDFHVAFNVNKAIEYNVQKCGLKWSSTILQGSPYGNMYWLQAYGSKGIDQRFKNDQQRVLKLAEENLPNLTTIGVLTAMEPVFYGQYRIFKDTVYFENPDFYRSLAVKLSSITELVQQGLLADEYCYEFIQPEGNAYGRFEYVDDPVETYGNKAKILYNEIVEWNSPPEDWQKGELTNILNFSPASFMWDLQDDTPVEINAERENPNWGREHKNEIYLARDQASNGKLVILQDVANGKAKFKQIPSTNVPRYLYNEDMHFIQGPVPLNLYSRYHVKQDPRRVDREIYEIPEIVIKFTLAFLDLVEEEGVNVYILTEKGKAIPSEIEVDFKLGIMRLKSLKC